MDDHYDINEISTEAIKLLAKILIITGLSVTIGIILFKVFTYFS